MPQTILLIGATDGIGRAAAKRLLDGQVVNVGSAAQAPADLAALTGKNSNLTPMEAYSQSKLALTKWSCSLARAMRNSTPAFITLNPGFLLAAKMVREGFGMDGSDVQIGADILVRTALSDEFSAANGRYYDNDAKRFNDPHPDALDADKCVWLMRGMDGLLEGAKRFYTGDSLA